MGRVQILEPAARMGHATEVGCAAFKTGLLPAEVISRQIQLQRLQLHAAAPTQLRQGGLRDRESGLGEDFFLARYFLFIPRLSLIQPYLCWLSNDDLEKLNVTDIRRCNLHCRGGRTQYHRLFHLATGRFVLSGV